jgi:hypothetical protein
VQNSLASAASEALSVPAMRTSTHWSMYAWATSTSVFTSASTNLVFWNEAIDVPNAVRCLT